MNLGDDSDTAELVLPARDGPVGVCGGNSVICTTLPGAINGEGGEDVISVVATGSSQVPSVVDIDGGPQSDVIAVHTDQGALLDATLDGGDAAAVDLLVRSAPGLSDDFAELGNNFELVLEINSSAPVVFVSSSAPVIFLSGGAGTLSRLDSSAPVVFLVTSFDMRLERVAPTWQTDFAFFLEPNAELSTTMTMPLADALLFLLTEDPIIVGPPL